MSEPTTPNKRQAGASRMLRVSHLVEMFSVSRPAIYRWIDRGHLPPAFLEIGRTPYWNLDEVLRTVRQKFVVEQPFGERPRRNIETESSVNHIVRAGVPSNDPQGFRSVLEKTLKRSEA